MLLTKGETPMTIFHKTSSTQLLDDVANKFRVLRGELGNFSHILNAGRTFTPGGFTIRGACF